MSTETRKIVQGCEVYAKAPERAKGGERTISLDELTGVQALERKHPDLPMQPGHVLRREFEYIRQARCPGSSILMWWPATSSNHPGDRPAPRRTPLHISNV